MGQANKTLVYHHARKNQVYITDHGDIVHIAWKQDPTININLDILRDSEECCRVPSGGAQSRQRSRAARDQLGLAQKRYAQYRRASNSNSGSINPIISNINRQLQEIAGPAVPHPSCGSHRDGRTNT